MRNPFFSLPRRSPTIVWTLLATALAAGCLTSGGRASELRRNAVVKAVAGARASVVNIHGQKTVTAAEDTAGYLDGPHKVNGMGTGVVIDDRGYIITNYHVVEGVRKIEVTLEDEETYVAQLVSNDPVTDLAIIQVNLPKKLPAIRIGRSSDLMPGESVIAVGNAFGYEHTVTQGIVSALHRTVQVSESQSYEDLIQTDASINPGNSGGPLLNIDGEMIGINVAVRGVRAQGIGFAIPVDKAMAVATSLLSINRIDDNWHGVTAKDSPDQEGLIVDSIAKDSPAADGGLQAGDLITSAAGQTIERPLDFERALLGHKAGDKVELAIERNQQPVQLSLVLAAKPKPTKIEEDPNWDLLGMRLTPIPPQQFRQYQSRYRGGLSVAAVRPDSPAAKQGIRRGDILVGMHVWETISLENVAYILNRPDFNDISPVKFYILRGSETLFGHLSVSMKTSKP